VVFIKAKGNYFVAFCKTMEHYTAVSFCWDNPRWRFGRRRFCVENFNISITL